MKLGTDIMAAVGGDGTINEVAKTLIGSDILLAVIPFGSGNGFARHFSFPLNISKAIKVIKSGYTDVIDVGLVNDSPFFCTSGLGFDAETGYQFSHFGKRGFFSYAFSLFRVFRKYNTCSYEIFFNNRSIKREAYFINVANISQYGYNFKIAPGARTNDGYLDLVIVKKFPKWNAVRLVLLSLTGNIHKSQFIEFHKADEIRIESDSDSNKIHIDGEPAEVNIELVYKIIPKSLRVILPSE
jgi:YegS/Rv2252/BmrU family lipid kinase